MSPRTGRPVSDNPRKHKVEIRMNDEELERLDYCCNAVKMSRSKVIRTGVDNIYNSLHETEEK